jgi:hypothetical protein
MHHHMNQLFFLLGIIAILVYMVFAYPDKGNKQL